MKTVILADGTFPSHPETLDVLEQADFLIACDGAADALRERGIKPQLVIGDLDSVSEETLQEYYEIVLRVRRQDNTDLMKALDWCIGEGRKEVYVLGATGKREDHTIGNIFTITTYAKQLRLRLYTDTGCFVALSKPEEIKTCAGQQISLFPQPIQMKITTKGLKYPLEDQALEHIHSGTLNEAEGESISLSFDQGILLVYQVYLSF